MLQFMCPHCNQILRVGPEYLGQRGQCKKCGGRIALIGNADTAQIQWASALGEDPAAPVDDRPATEKQLAYLRKCGMPAESLKHISLSRASKLIDEAREKQGQEPPTEKQIAHLRRLGAHEDQIEALVHKQDATLLIEDMHLQPTGPQIALLQKLGASGGQIARLRSKGDASALIDKLR